MYKNETNMGTWHPMADIEKKPSNEIWTWDTYRRDFLPHDINYLTKIDIHILKF